MRFHRAHHSSSIRCFAGFCGALLLAGCGSGAAPVGLTTPTLAFATIATQSYGGGPFTVVATSASSGTVTYSVTSGPAVVSGNLVFMTGVGAVVLGANQAASGNYSAATATTSFMVTQGTPTLSFAPIPTQISRNLPFNVTASSASTGAITYSVTSGPANIIGNHMVALTGATGTVNLSASQAATTNYAAATATTSFSVVATGSTPGTSFSGRVTVNGLPVVGASVQLYDVGTSGNGSQPNPRLTLSVGTDLSGNFTVPSSFSCVSANTSLFLLAEDGKPASGVTTNSLLWLATVLPPCGSLTSSMNFTVNELTTVAMTEALAQFMTAGGNVGASGSNALGMTNAMLTAQALGNSFTGVSPGASVPANVTVNSAKLNSLANAFSACAANSTACTPLFAAATVGGVVPMNTLDAALAIARNPSNNVATLFALSTGTTFSPALTAAPPDWMIFLTLSGGGLSAPTAIGVDGSGNLWSADYNEALSVFAPNGATAYASGITNAGLHESFGVAIDASNDIWVESDETPGSPHNGGSLAKFNDSGTAITSGIGYTAGLYYPTGIAADPNGDMWIANYGNSTYALYNSSGTAITPNCTATSGCGSGELEFPVAVAVDSNHIAWFANQSSTTLTRVTLDGNSLTPIICCDGASGVAVDAQNNVWAANYFGDNVSELAETGAVISSGYTGGGVDHPQGIAVDGGGSVWVANYRGSSLTKLAGANAAVPGAALSPSTGFGTDATLLEPFALAIDASGNMWVSNQALNTITEFIGVAVPVKTPLVGPPQVP